MRTRMLLAGALAMAAMAGPAAAQSSGDASMSRNFPADPRDRYDPKAKAAAPNRVNPSLGKVVGPTSGAGSSATNAAPGSVPKDDPSADASSSSAIVGPAQVQLPPGSSETLSSMGDMQLYTPPSAAQPDAQFSSLPGMAIYRPPSADSDPAGYNGYPAWWPQ